MPHSLFRAAGGFQIGFALLVCATVCVAQEAREAQPRFGDSTWVAPSNEIEGTPAAEGPRVARPDRERGWETALRVPFRVAFFPLRLVARGIEATGGVVERVAPPGSFSGRGPKKGLKVTPDWIGAKATAHQIVGPGSQLSLKGTLTPGARKLRLRGHVGDQVSYIGAGGEALYDYRPTRAFYGIGNSSDSRRTYFRRRMDLGSGYLFAGRNWMRRLRASVGISDATIGSATRRSPRAVDVFTETEAPFLNRGSSLWWIGSSADLATSLDDSLSPTLGVHFRPEVRRYRSSDDTNIRYDYWRLDARGYLPVFAKRRVLVGRLVYAGVDRRDGSAPVPFYRLPETADADHFAAYPTGRFRDNRLALGHAEYRWEIMPPISAVLLGELGAVASTSSRLTLRGAHPALGGGLRAKVGERRVARLDIAKGHEGMNVRLDLEADF